jgi:hypothetical protein
LRIDSTSHIPVGSEILSSPFTEKIPNPNSENRQENEAGDAFYLASGSMSDNRHNNHWHGITPQIDKLIRDRNIQRPEASHHFLNEKELSS